MDNHDDAAMKRGMTITFGSIFAIFLFLLVLANAIG